MRLADAVVLVVGSTGGIGSACAQAASRRGARVIVHGRDSDRLDAAAAGADAKSLCADLTEPGAPEALAEAAREIHGRVDSIIHCAGTGWRGRTDSMSPDEVDGLIAVNLAAPLRITRALLGDMHARGFGHIAFLASIAGWVGVNQESVYAAAKAGVIIYAESLRIELAGSGIGVSVVSPAAVQTPFFDRRGVPYDRRVPRLLDPDRVAEAVVRSIERDVAHRMIPRWLAVAPAVRTAAPGAFRALNTRFGQPKLPPE